MNCEYDKPRIEHHEMAYRIMYFIKHNEFEKRTSFPGKLYEKSVDIWWC